MKASETGTVKTSERTKRRTTVALALRNKTLALTLSARLVADCDAVASICPFGNPTQLEQWLEDHPADVLLLEERWLPRLAAGTMPHLSERWPDQRVLLVGDRAGTALAEQVVRNRLHGFLLAKDAADACAKAVSTVRRGELWMPRALLVQLLFEHLHAAGTGSAETADDKLTPREVEIVSYVRRGFTNKQIGEALAIREDTVKKHLRNAYTKLGVHRRTQIITGAAQRFITG
jgi:DNA-binding NarL/FixJ family response regulator